MQEPRSHNCRIGTNQSQQHNSLQTMLQVRIPTSPHLKKTQTKNQFTKSLNKTPTHSSQTHGTSAATTTRNRAMKNRHGTLIPLPRRPTKLDRRIREGTAQSRRVKWQHSGVGEMAQQRRWRNGAAAAATKPPPPRCSGGAVVVQRWWSWNKRLGRSGRRRKYLDLRGDARRRRMEEDALRGYERIWVFFNPKKPYMLRLAAIPKPKTPYGLGYKGTEAYSVSELKIKKNITKKLHRIIKT